MAGTYDSIIKQKIKDWKCDSLMKGASADRGKKFPFSSPLMNWATYGGIPRDRITEFCGEPGGGKAQPLYSKVLTPNGFVCMGDIKVGDEVFDSSGEVCRVTAIYPQGKRPIYEITTQGNNKIRVADNHLNSVWWYNKHKQCREDFVWTTEELIEQFNSNRRKIRIDIPSVNWGYREVPVEPYLLGALIGDGSLSDSGFGFTNSEPDITRKVNALLSEYDYELYELENYSGQYRVRVKKDKYVPGVKTGLHRFIEDMQLNCKSVDKHIPDEYLLNSADVRLALLQGLFDTDGHITTEGKVEFSTSSKQLSDDFAFLVRSLGIRDTITTRMGSYRKDGQMVECSTCYRHTLKVPNGLKFYSSEKHSLRYKDRQHPPMRNITSIEYIGDEECQCIMVDSPLHTYISDDFIPTHNTTTAIDICKNAHEQFVAEYEEKVNSYRERIANGEKGLTAEMEDYIEIGPKKVIYIDLEHGFDGAWAETLGITSDEVDIMQPPDVTAEELLQTIQELIETGEVGLIVMDSIPSLVTKSELEKKYGERTVASLAGLMTVFCRKVTSLLTRYNTTLIFINQTRDNLENPYAIQTPGGKAVKFYSSLRILFKIGKPVDFLGNELPQHTENPAGYIVNARLLKQKTAPFDRKDCSYYLMAHSGIRTDMDYAQLAIKRYGIIKKSGGWFTMCVPTTGEVLEDENGKVIKINGMNRVYDFLQTNTEYYEQLKEFILNDINGITTEQLAEADLSL